MNEVGRGHAGEMGIIPGHLSSPIAAFQNICIYKSVSTSQSVGVRFEWDPAKAASNEAKHGVRFEDAVRVFADPLARTIQDRHEAGEERWQTTGLVDGLILLVVAHTIRDDPGGDEIVRVISARRATKLERRFYERG